MRVVRDAPPPLRPRPCARVALRRGGVRPSESNRRQMDVYGSVWVLNVCTYLRHGEC